MDIDRNTSEIKPQSRAVRRHSAGVDNITFQHRPSMNTSTHSSGDVGGSRLKRALSEKFSRSSTLNLCSRRVNKVADSNWWLHRGRATPRTTQDQWVVSSSCTGSVSSKRNEEWEMCGLREQISRQDSIQMTPRPVLDHHKLKRTSQRDIDSRESFGNSSFVSLSSSSTSKSDEQNGWHQSIHPPCRSVDGKGPKPTCILKGKHKVRTNKHVTYSEVDALILQGSGFDRTEKWFKRSDDEQFLQDAIVNAKKIDRAMHYAASIEDTYRSSTGLTSPQTLKEYLSCPEEIIGIEHLLTNQRRVRENLKQRHYSALLEEQHRQKQEGYNPDKLAQMMICSSDMSAHMARERAAYITLLD